MLHQLQHLMGSPAVFSKLEVTSVVVVAIVAGMVLGGLVGTAGPRRIAGAPLGYSIASPRMGGSRAQRVTRSSADRAAFAGWPGAGPDGTSHGSGQWVNLSAAATYLAPTTMLPLAALPSAASLSQVPQQSHMAYRPQVPQQSQVPVHGPQLPIHGPHLPVQAPQSPVSLLAPQSPAFLLAAPMSPAIPLSPGGPSVVELQPVAFLPGVYQAAAYRLDVTGRMDADQAGGPIRPLWRLGNALFSAARGSTARAVAPPAGSPPDAAARPGRHRASRSKRIRRSSITGASDTWTRK